MLPRRFLLFLSLALAALAADAQEPRKMARIGILHQVRPSDTFQGFRRGLKELGYVEGQHVELEYRWPEHGPEGYPLRGPHPQGRQAR
jgi:putative tryptophan/tyrosine transport system substrate-binding protein